MLMYEESLDSRLATVFILQLVRWFLICSYFLKSTQPMSPLCFWQCFFRMALQWRSRTKKETKSLPTLPREEPEDAALHLEEMMIVRILSEVLVFIGPESNHWQCISTCGIITKSVSTVFWGRLLGRNWIWGSILSPHAPHHHGIVHDHLERPTSRKYNAGKIFLSTHVDNGNEDAINEAEGAWTSPVSSRQSIKRRSENNWKWQIDFIVV